MNPYTEIRLAAKTAEAASLSERLAAWHDEMVAHERLLRAGRGVSDCDEECPHAEARELWAQAVREFGAAARGLSFLKSRAHAPQESAVG